MPHLHIDYSANLDGLIDIAALCEAVRAAAAEVEAFPTAGIRVRALRAEHYAIADGNPAHGYVDLQIRVREGRPQEVKKAAVDHIFDAMKRVMSPALQTHPIALSAEIRDIDAVLSPKFGTIRDHLGDGA